MQLQNLERRFEKRSHYPLGFAHSVMITLDEVFVKKIKFCDKHNCEKIYSHKFKKYGCRNCKQEYAELYRKKNFSIIKEKNRLYNFKIRLKRQEWIKKDREENPERYKKYNKKYYNDESKQFSEKRLSRRYGLTLDEYNRLIKDCNNSCQICDQKETRKTGKSNKLTRLSIDHCHITNKVRGILCFTCNLGIGKFKDNINLLNKAIIYLKKHQ